MLESALKDSEDKCSDIEKELSDAHDHINMVESQLATANDRLLELEQCKAVVEAASSERLAEITELQRRLEGNQVKEDLVGELNRQVAALERQLAQLQEEVRGKKRKSQEIVCVCISISCGYIYHATHKLSIHTRLYS